MQLQVNFNDGVFGITKVSLYDNGGGGVELPKLGSPLATPQDMG